VTSGVSRFDGTPPGNARLSGLAPELHERGIPAFERAEGRPPAGVSQAWLSAAASSAVRPSSLATAIGFM
jgi:hypothetical protein